jgi:hypothetical protein
MSTDYRLIRKVAAWEVFDGRLEEFGVHEHVEPDTTIEKTRLLTDGRNYLWVYIDDDGLVASLTRYAYSQNKNKRRVASTRSTSSPLIGAGNV